MLALYTSGPAQSHDQRDPRAERAEERAHAAEREQHLKPVSKLVDAQRVRDRHADGQDAWLERLTRGGEQQANDQ